VSSVDADIDALKRLREALTRFRYAQQQVTDRVGSEIETARASLAEKASRCRGELQQRQAELDACRDRAANTTGEESLVDCSGYVRAVAETQQRLEHVQLWQQRVDEEAGAFRGTADGFRALLETDLPRSEAHLAAAIASLEAARGLHGPGS